MENGTKRVEPTPIAGVFNAAGMVVDDSGDLPVIVLACNRPRTTLSAPPAVYAFVIETNARP